MRAVVYDRYGPPEVQRLEEVERPVPKADEVLVKIHATTVNRLDCHTREANGSGGLAVQLISRLIFGARRPRQRILGSEYAGKIVAVGDTVREFAVGDDVFGITGISFGAHAEFISVQERSRMARKPAGMTFEQATVQGTAIRRKYYTTLTLLDALWHHFIAAMATCETTARLCEMKR